jgi:hypothetical protein
MRTSLHQLQRDLQAHILGGPSPIDTAIVDAPPLATDQRLHIYRNAYQVRLIEALDDIYPILHQILGDDVFSSLGESFVATAPSTHRSIRWYGRELPDFLARESPYADQPILAEIGRFEWALSEVFDADDAECIDRSALAAVAPDAWASLRFHFHPSLRRQMLAWNAPAVWQAVSREEGPPQPALAATPAAWLLWRQNLQNSYRPLDADEDAALSVAMAGGTFGDVCEGLADYCPQEEIPLRAATLVATWADRGMLVAIEL